MRTLLVDDEAPARARLRRLLAAHPEIEVVGEADSGTDAVTHIAELAPDLVLLDIQMPGLDGFGVLEAVASGAAAGRSTPLVIVVTAYDEHAVRAFEAEALDYLLKPVAPERLAVALERAGRRLAGRRATPGESSLPEQLERVLAAIGREREPLHHLLVHDGERARFVAVAQIHRVSAERNYVRVHAGRETYVLRSTLDALERRLDPRLFLRVNRSDIVRLDAVTELHPWSHGDYHMLLADGTRVVWSRRYRARDAHRLGAGTKSAPPG